VAIVQRPSCEAAFILVRSQMNLEFSRQILEKNSNIKFHENTFSGSRVPCGGTDGWTDRQTYRVRERDRETEK
jgi:hypothetical protein